RRDAGAAPHREHGGQNMTHGGGPGATIAGQCRGEVTRSALTTGSSDLRPLARAVRFSDGLTGIALRRLQLYTFPRP
ncbi:MAG: hypothetical protein ACREJN_11015, partial [Nitrospiraceae bacterium]